MDRPGSDFTLSRKHGSYEGMWMWQGLRDDELCASILSQTLIDLLTENRPKRSHALHGVFSLLDLCRGRVAHTPGVEVSGDFLADHYRDFFYLHLPASFLVMGSFHFRQAAIRFLFEVAD